MPEVSTACRVKSWLHLYNRPDAGVVDHVQHQPRNDRGPHQQHHPRGGAGSGVEHVAASPLRLDPVMHPSQGEHRSEGREGHQRQAPPQSQVLP